MKSYKEIAEMLMEKIEKTMDCPRTRGYNLYNLTEAWISYAERDQETPEAEKREHCLKLIGFIEKELEALDPEEKIASRALNLTFVYIQLRQILEPQEEGQKKAQTVHIVP